MDLQINNVGLIQDLSDLMTELEAEKTPAYSLIKKGKAPGNPIMQKPVDAPGFAPRSGQKNKTPAGGAVDQSKDYAVVESLNHWVRVTVSVGKKDQLTANRAGVGFKQLFAREAVKGTRAEKTAINSIILDNFDQREETDAQGSETRGLFQWASPTAQSCRPVADKYRPSAGQRYTGALSAITMDTIAEMLDERYSVTKDSTKMLCFCGPSFKRHVSRWSRYMPDVADCSTVRRFNNDMGKDERLLRSVIDFLEFDTGRLELHLDPNLLGDRRATSTSAMSDEAKCSFIAFPQDAASLHFAEEPNLEILPSDGGSKSGQISSIFHTMADGWQFISGICTAA